MEDVLEQIVGEIEDEFDTPDEEGDIFALADGSYRVAGDLDLSRAVQAFDLHLPAHAMENFDTLGGYVAAHPGPCATAGPGAAMGRRRSCACC